MTTTTALEAVPEAITVRSESHPVTPEHYGENGYPVPNGHVQPPTSAPIKGPALPTFPLEAGWREVYDPATKSYRQQPLTLLDILFPAEDNMDVVFMAQSPLHNLWLRWLSAMLETYLRVQKLITNDILIHWGRAGAPPKSPDLAVMPQGHLPDEKKNRIALTVMAHPQPLSSRSPRKRHARLIWR